MRRRRCSSPTPSTAGCPTPGSSMHSSSARKRTRTLRSVMRSTARGRSNRTRPSCSRTAKTPAPGRRWSPCSSSVRPIPLPPALPCREFPPTAATPCCCGWASSWNAPTARPMRFPSTKRSRVSPATPAQPPKQPTVRLCSLARRGRWTRRLPGAGSTLPERRRERTRHKS